MATIQCTESEARLFETLRRLRDEECLRDIDHAMREVSQAVQASHKKGAVKVTITITPVSKGGRGAANVQCNISTTRPEPTPDERLFFVDDNGALVTFDPRQQQLFPKPPAQAEPQES